MRPGDEFGRYRIESALGEGGMGRVFSAWDTMLERRVALKVLHVEGDADARARLLREARAAAALEHPNAVRVYDVGDVEGVSFLAMELLEGHSLRSYVGDESVSVATKIRWLGDVARALDAAHRRGLVHRDVKPENVHVGVDGQVRVLDFGIARPVTPGTPMGTITRDGLVLGTPRYMSPEQLANEVIDGRSDQFSWGVLAFELLAGRSPWSGDDPVKVIAQILGTSTPQLDAIARVPAGAARVIARATEKDPLLRFPSMLDAANALEAAVTGSAMATTVAAPSVRTTTRSPRPPAKGWKGRAAGIGLAMVAAGGVLAWLAARDGARATDVRTDAARPIDPAPHAPPDLSKAALDAYASAWIAYRAGNAGLASQRFRAATTIEPTNAAAWVRIAVLELHRDSEAARDAFRRAAEQPQRLDAHDTDFFEGMRPLLQQDPPDIEASRAAFERYAAKWTDDPEMLWYLSETYLGLGRFADSERVARRAVDVDRGFLQGYYDLIEATSYLGRFDESLRLIDECTQRQPAATDCLFERYYVRSHTGRCDLLDGDARRAVLLAPEAVRAQWFRVKSFLAEGKSASTMDEVIGEWVARLPPEARAQSTARAHALVAARDGDFTAAERYAEEWAKGLADRTLRPDHGAAAALDAELAEERGDLVTAGKRAAAFLDRRDAWVEVAERDDSAVESDVTMELAELAHVGGAYDAPRVAATRATFLAQWNDVRNGYRPVVWMDAWAKSARTPAEAREALDHLDEFGAPPPFTAITVDYAFTGHTYLLAGRVDEADRWLRLAANSCDYAWDPIALTRATLWWGEALDAKGNKKGACDAYARVVARWGHAVPRSVTAEEAREKAGALGCR